MKNLILRAVVKYLAGFIILSALDIHTRRFTEIFKRLAFYGTVIHSYADNGISFDF